jgi:hypothetical protein
VLDAPSAERVLERVMVVNAGFLTSSSELALCESPLSVCTSMQEKLGKRNFGMSWSNRCGEQR